MVSALGGILSNSAIVAREYGITAVVGVRDALKLADDSLAVADGFNGRISIIDCKQERSKSHPRTGWS